MTNMNTQQTVENIQQTVELAVVDLEILIESSVDPLKVAKALLADPVMGEAIQQAIFGCCNKTTHPHGCANTICHTSLESVSFCKPRS